MLPTSFYTAKQARWRTNETQPARTASRNRRNCVAAGVQMKLMALLMPSSWMLMTKAILYYLYIATPRTCPFHTLLICICVGLANVLLPGAHHDTYALHMAFMRAMCVFEYIYIY